MRMSCEKSLDGSNSEIVNASSHGSRSFRGKLPATLASLCAESTKVREGQSLQPSAVSHQVSPPSTRLPALTVCPCIAPHDWAKFGLQNSPNTVEIRCACTQVSRSVNANNLAESDGGGGLSTCHSAPPRCPVAARYRSASGELTARRLCL